MERYDSIIGCSNQLLLRRQITITDVSHTPYYADAFALDSNSCATRNDALIAPPSPIESWLAQAPAHIYVPGMGDCGPAFPRDLRDSEFLKG